MIGCLAHRLLFTAEFFEPFDFISTLSRGISCRHSEVRYGCEYVTCCCLCRRSSAKRATARMAGSPVSAWLLGRAVEPKSTVPLFSTRKQENWLTRRQNDDASAFLPSKATKDDGSIGEKTSHWQTGFVKCLVLTRISYGQCPWPFLVHGRKEPNLKSAFDCWKLAVMLARGCTVEAGTEAAQP